MGKCSDCGKKLGYFESFGHIIDNKEFCEDCYNKRKGIKDKKELSSQEKPANNELEQRENLSKEWKKIPWIITIAVLIYIIVKLILIFV
jgi:hypothetical protein